MIPGMANERYDVIVVGVGGFGSAALHHLARRGQRVLGLERFEFLGGEDEYKLQFANSSRTLLLFQAFRRTLSGVLRYSAYSFGAPLVRTARSTLGR